MQRLKLNVKCLFVPSLKESNSLRPGLTCAKTPGNAEKPTAVEIMINPLAFHCLILKLNSSNQLISHSSNR